MSKLSASPSTQKTWPRILTIVVCAVLAVVSVILLDRIFKEFSNKEFDNINPNDYDNSNFFVFLYETNLTDGSSFIIKNLHSLEKTLMKQWQLTNVNILSAQFIPLAAENADRKRRELATKSNINNQYKANKIYKGDPLLISLTVQTPFNCISMSCVNNFISEVTNTIAFKHRSIDIPIKFSDNKIVNVHLMFSSDQQSTAEYLRENNERSSRYKRQSSNSSSFLVDVPDPIFFPQVIGNFQLALKSDTSIVVIIGNDYNLYLSNTAVSKTSATLLSLVDLMVASGTNAAMIKDAATGRFVHPYDDIRDNGYSHIRTHLDSHMPCEANMIFWTFENGYLQFYRGGNWFYDTVGCMDSTTGLVKVWLINGQQGLTAIQTALGNCALAPLIPINYD